MYGPVGIEVFHYPLFQVEQRKLAHLPAQEHAAVGYVGEEVAQHDGRREHGLHEAVAAHEEELARLSGLDHHRKPVLGGEDKRRGQQRRRLYFLDGQLLAVGVDHARAHGPRGQYVEPLAAVALQGDDVARGIAPQAVWRCKQKGYQVVFVHPPERGYF